MATKPQNEKISYHEKYNEFIYSRRQMRDTIAGAHKVKKSGELYLPMPSSWHNLDYSQVKKTLPNDIVSNNLPYHHKNPAYSAYLQRARFPDITANALRGMSGFATKIPPKIEVPKSMEYLVNSVNSSGESLIEFFNYLVIELLSVGNVNVVVDVNSITNEFYMTTYSAECTINWDYSVVHGGIDLLEINFLEPNENVSVYSFNSNLEVMKKTIDKNGNESDELVISYVGKKYPRIPVFPVGSLENTPDPQPIPLLGISDISIEIYQENADLRQAHFMTCNPTLFIFGAKEREKPSAIGSQVVVMIENPNAKAEYPSTDTSALDHIAKHISGLYSEAANYGANFLTTGARESGEALNIRQANKGTNLVHCVKQAGKAVSDALKMIATMKGENADEIIFDPSTEFAEVILNAQDINALVAGWLQGAWDRETVLDNMRVAGYIPHNKTNEKIIENVEIENPSV